MKKICAGFVFLSLFMLLPLLCYPTVLEDEQAKISIWYPDTWTMQSDDENTILVTDPHKELAVVYTILEGNILEKALEALESQLNGLACDLRALDEPEEDLLNGMKCVLLDVTAKIKNTPMRIGVVIVFTPGQKILLVTAMTPLSKYTQYENLISDIITEIKPLK